MNIMPENAPERNGKGYSITAFPHGPIEELLRGAAEDLSQRYGTKLFAPHLTIEGNLPFSEEEVRERLQKVAQEIEPFDVRITGFARTDSVKAVVLGVEITPEINEVVKKIRRAFEVPESDSRDYWSHISIAYHTNTISEEEQKKIAQEYGDIFNHTFRVDKISIYYTIGTVDKWYRVEDFPLGKAKTRTKAAVL